MKTKILIADDDVIYRKTMSFMLKKENYETYEAKDGNEAIKIALGELPDLILLDIIMPEKNGYQVCYELQQDSRSQNIPIIFLTSLHELRDKIKGLDIGAVDYISKTCDRRETLARIRSQLRIRQLTRSLVLANNDLLAQQQQLEEDLQAAANIQKSLILRTSPQIPGLNVAWQYLPCERVGGDIFNIYQLDEKHLALFMLDVSGHGVPAAMVTVSASQSLSPQTGHILKKKAPPPRYYDIMTPTEVLNQLDAEYPIERFGKYFTISYLVLNFRTGELRYSSAAHPPPVVVRSDGNFACLEEGGAIIGLGGLVPFEAGETRLSAGDRLFLYTDGIVEFENRHHDVFGEERFYNELVHCHTLPLQRACDSVIQSLLTYGEGIKPQDDISLLAIEYTNNE